jgi:AraC-like DNA-binding protein
MQPSFEKLIPPTGSSIRCFDRSIIERPAGWHYHPEVEICFTERGSGTRFVGDHIGNYGDGDLVLLGANLPHHWASDEFRGQRYDRHSAIVVQFDPVQFGTQFFGLPEMAETVELLERAGRGLHVTGSTRRFVADAAREMLEQSPAARLLSLLNILHLLSRSAELVPLASPGFAPTFRPRLQNRLNRVCKHIHDHLADPGLNQADLAKLAGMHPSAFSRFFKNGTQRTVTDYVNELRIGLASRLLLETELSILEICLRSGYENASNFNRRFREYRGMTPREFRAAHRAPGGPHERLLEGSPYSAVTG